MSKGIRRPHLKLKSPFDAKRVIVAACAAIAMLLGATSVGASISDSHEQVPTTAEVSSIIKSVSPKRVDITVPGGGLTKQHTIGGRSFLEQQVSPLYAVPPSGKSSPKNPLSPVFPINSTVNATLSITQTADLPQATAASEKAKDANVAPEATKDGVSGGTTQSTESNSSTETTSGTGSTSESPASTSTDGQSPTVMDFSPTPSPNP